MSEFLGGARPFASKIDETAYLDDLSIRLGSGSTYRGFAIGAIILLFNLWDRIIDSAHADTALLWRVAACAAILPVHGAWVRSRHKTYALYRRLVLTHSVTVPFALTGAAASLDGGLQYGLPILLFIYMWLPSVLPMRRDAMIGSILSTVIIVGVTVAMKPERSLIANSIFFSILGVFFAVVIAAKFDAALRRAWVQEQSASREARTDPLTGAVNRRHFAEAAAAEKGRCTRYNHTGAMILFDLDHFKRLNDTHGHPTGDRALKAVADACAEEIRATDLLARFGGEEFAILLPETSMEEAARLAERLRHRIAAIELVADKGMVKMTASFGVAPLPATPGSWEESVAAADAALYRAKEQGRNQVQIEAAAAA
jgi:diguanylate cyclase (GGDEF)-like protein